MQGTARSSARCDGEVLHAVLNAPLLVCAGNGMLESGGVGGVTGNRNADVLQLHDRNALGNVVRTVALDCRAGTVRERLGLHDLDRLGVGVELGLAVGETVDAGDDVSRILAKTVQNHAQGLLAHLVRVQCDLDRALCRRKGLVSREEAEALGLLGEKHFAEVAVSQTDLAVLRNRAGNAEALQTDTDVCRRRSRALVTRALRLFDGDCRADRVSPLCVFKADRLGLLDDGVSVNALLVADVLAFVDGRNAVFLQNAENLCLASLISFKLCHLVLPP